MLTSSDVKWISVSAAARELRVSSARVRQLIKAGALAGQMSGNTWLVSVASISARLAKLEKEGTGDGNIR